MQIINENDIETIMILISRIQNKEEITCKEYQYMQTVLDHCIPLIAKEEGYYE